jgi:general secretion pathway protein L
MSRLLGIDASKSVVRTALVRTSYRRVTVEAFSEIDVAQAGSEADAIRTAVGLVKPDAVAIGLTGERSLYRRLELPQAAQKEIGNVLAFELESTVPFEMDDAVFDYRVLKKASPTSPMIPLFAAIAKATDVRERIQLVRDALGVDPERVGTGPVSLANLAVVCPDLEKPKSPGPVAILSLAETVTEILIMAGGEPRFARTLSRGMSSLPAGVPALVRELRQSFAAWLTLGGERIGALILVGPGALDPTAARFLGDALGVDVVPFPACKFDGLTPENQAKLPRFAQALGIALGLSTRPRSLNLRRGALETERSYPFLREKVPVLVGLGAVIAVSFGFSVAAELRTLGAEHDLLSAKLGAATRDVLGEETTDPEKANELLARTVVDEDPMPHADAFDALVQFSKAVPKDVVHDVLEFDYARQHVVVHGVVPSVADAETIAKNLKEYKCAKEVKIGRTSAYGDGKNKYVLDFDLKCRETPKKTTKKHGSDEAGAASSAKSEPGKDGGR